GRPSERSYVTEAVGHLDADLDTRAALSCLDRLAEDDSVPPGAKFETAIELDMVLGLDLVRLVGRL
ncbi:MAG: cysteine--tRNA ligase, partial [Actinoallomurus sp.]